MVNTTHLQTESSPPLAGIRVLDLSRVLAGPFAATVLGDLGAEVLKVESPWGDDTRAFGPFIENGDSAYYRLVNRNKKGITLDFKNPDDVETLLDLVERMDVVVENFRPGVLAKLGISPEVMLKRNPALVVTSISGFGQTGSMNNTPAYDLVAQAMSGLMSVTGWQDSGPTRVGVSLGDLVPGLYAVIATQAALRQRDFTGNGQHVDLAMYDSLVSLLESVAMRQLHSTECVQAVGNDHAMTVPFSTYQTKDEEIVIAVSNDRLFERLTDALSIPEAKQDDRFATYNARFQHRDEIRALLEASLQAYSARDAVQLLNDYGVPASRIFSVEEALCGDLAKEREVLVDEDDGFTTLASPIKLPGMKRVPVRGATLGEHNHVVSDILQEPRLQTGQVRKESVR